MRKRRVSRRLLAVLLALTMCLALLPITALAEEIVVNDPPDGETVGGTVEGGIAPIAEGDGFKQVTKIEDITAGGEFVLVAEYESKYYALPSNSFTGRPNGVEVNVSSGAVTASEGNTLPVWTATAQANGAVSFNNGTAYLGSGSSTSFTSQTSGDNDNAIWNVTANGGNTFVFANPTNKNRGIIFQGSNNGASTCVFGNYAATNVAATGYNGYLLVFTSGNVTPSEPETKVKELTATPSTGSTVAQGATVTLSCITKDVTYQTSANGTEWTPLEGNTFKIPEDASGTYSISVKAAKSGLEDSEVLELEYTILDTSNVSTIADARKGSAGTSSAPGDTFTVSGVVTYVSGSNFYIQDETAGIVLYDNSLSLKRGQEVTVSGGLADYNGLLELCKVTVIGTKEGALPAPKDIAIPVIDDTVQAQLVKITGAKVEDVNGKRVTLSPDGTTDKTIAITNCPTIEELTKGDTVTVTAVVSKNSDGNYLLVNSKDDIVITDDVTPEPEQPDEPGKELYKPADGDKVAIYYPGSKLVMTGEASGTRLKGVEVPVSGGMLYTGDALILTAAVDSDGYYTFTTADGKVLNTGATGNNMTLVAAADAVCSKWEITAAAKGDGWLIRSTQAEYSGNKNQYIEYYSGFTTYSLKDGADQGIYTMLFYPESSVRTIDWTVDTDVEQTIAQWGGALKAYDNPGSVTSISGDLLKVGDELDTDSQYTVVKGGVVSTPLAASTKPNYYMGGEGLKNGDYAQFATSSKGWGGMELSFRMRVTKAGASKWQVQYSTNGSDFADFDAGSYSVSGTAYVNGEQQTVSRDGKISNGIVPASEGYIGSDVYYMSVTLPVPVGAENADELYIRLVSGNEKISGTGDASGNIRIDTLKLVGSPVVSKDVTGYVTIDPESDEDVGSGAEIKLTAASGAKVYYGWADNETGAVTYTEGNTTTVPGTLPATLFVYASSAGKDDSVVRKMTYLPAAVASVQMTPNGGGVYLSGGTAEVTLATATDGATIYYTRSDWAKIKNDKGEDVDKYEIYTPGTTRITLTDGFGTLTVSAYAVLDGFSDSAVTTRTFTQREGEKYQLFFGQMHSHTSYSDGAGTAAQAFSSTKALDQDTWNMDFLSVTDHSNSFDDAGGSKRLADAPTGQEWNEGKKLASDITDGSFVGIFGYEMTWSNGLGHINTFNTPGYQDRTQSDYTTYSTALQNYYAELKTVPTSISQFNHPGTTFGDFSDFAHYDEEIDQLITLIEVGNGEGAIGSSGYFPSYEYYTRALDKGWHVAPTNNQDNHKGGWGTSNTGRDVVLVDELSEQAIYDAMRNYRVYATEDLNLEIYYTFDGQIMGSILDADGYKDKTATISVELKDPNNEKATTVQVIVNGGKVLTQKENVTCNETVTFEIEKPADYAYYYIKIVQDDGDIAVTAPVWVGAVEAVGITSLKAENALTVVGQPQSFTLELYNNEKKNFEVSSITFTDKATGETLGTPDTAVTAVKKMGTASTGFSCTFSTDGVVTVLATVKGTLNGVEKTYTQELELNVMPQNLVKRVIVDGSHYNDYTTGYYGGRMGNMTTIAAGRGVEVVVAREITADMLNNCELLVISAPARKSGTDNAGAYVPSSFEDSFIDMVKGYVDKGGSVVVCGLADYQDKGAASADKHAAAQINKLLEAIGSTMTINDDEAYDKVHNGGQEYRLYPEIFNMDSKWCKGIVTADSVKEGENYQTYSQYSGCTVNLGSGGTWLVKGFDTTYSIDSDGDSKGGIPEGSGPVYFLACEDSGRGGTIFAAGAVCFSNFEVAAELDNIWDLPYANRTIFENILGSVRENIEITPIAETRRAGLNKVFTIEGYVTSGTTNPNTTFFDSIYVQDETGGTDVFPYAVTGLAIGTKVRVLGYTDAYQGDRELQVINLEVLDAPARVYEPKMLTTEQATDYGTYGGQLISVSGTVSDIVMAGGRVSQFKVTDSSGKAATVFIDGYITNPSGENNIHTWLKDGQTVSAAGLLYSHPEGDSDVSVPVLRVRNCDEITRPSDTGSSGTGGSAGRPAVSQPETPTVSDGQESVTIDVPAAPEPERVSEIIASYEDVSEDDWYADYAAYMINSGLMTGTDAGSFSPDEPLTRGMLVTILHRAAGQPDSSSADFSDVAAGSWFANGVTWAASKGLVNGYGDGTFRPNANISRQELAVILWRFAQKLGLAGAGDAAELSGFADSEELASWAYEAMSWACRAGIITGRNGTHLAPNDGASRAETAAMVVRFLKLVEENRH